MKLLLGSGPFLSYSMENNFLRSSEVLPVYLAGLVVLDAENLTGYIFKLPSEELGQQGM